MVVLTFWIAVSIFGSVSVALAGVVDSATSTPIDFDGAYSRDDINFEVF